MIFFDKLYEKMSETEKRAFYEKLIKEVQVYEELARIGGISMENSTLSNVDLPLEKLSTHETVVLLNNKNVKPKDYVEIGIDAEEYYKIKDSEKESK